MPGSQWTTSLFKFGAAGVQTAVPPDLLQDGKYRLLKNVRSRLLGAIQPRPGTINWATTGSHFNGRDYHTVKSFATLAGFDILIVGLGTEAGRYSELSGHLSTSGEFGAWSSNPFSVVIDNPENFATSFAYVYDEKRQRKFDISGNSYEIGINPPGRNDGLFSANDYTQPYDLAATAAPTVATAGAGNLVGIYIYKYRYHSTVTGARSNFSDISDEIIVTAEQVNVGALQGAGDPQVDEIEIYRLGGTLLQFTFVDAVANPGAGVTTSYVDNLSDETVAVNDTEELFERDKPWAGIRDDSGNYLGGYKLRYVAGPFVGYELATGDPFRRGYLYWTNINDPDSSDRANNLKVSENVEPLLSPLIYDGRAFVFTPDSLYAIYPRVAGFATFEVLATPCHRGLWSPWSFAVGDEIYFLSRDGIYATDGGPARMLSADIYNLFPHEDSTGEPQIVNGIVPPQMNVAFDADLYRLSYADGFLYFDYIGIDNNMHTLVLDINANAWFYDQYAAPVRLHYEIQGQKDFGVPAQHAVQKSRGVILATRDGGVLKFFHGALDQDGPSTASPIDCEVRTPMFTAGEDRTQKLHGDILLEADRAGIDIDVTPVADNEDVSDTTTTLNSGAGRQNYPIDISPQSGILARNLGLNIGWTIDTANSSREGPFLYSWAPSWILKPDETVRRFIEWHPLGEGLTDGYVWGIEMWIDTEGQDVRFQVFADQAFTGIEFTCNANGEQRLRFAWPARSFKASLMKVVPIIGNVNPWRLTRWLWLADEEPPRVPDWDSNWKNPLEKCQIAYITGYKIEADTFAANKTLILESEFEGTITVHTPREGNVINHNGRKTMHLTFDEPFRAEQVRMHTVDGNLFQVYSECWIAHPEPPFLANWDATFVDHGRPHLIKGVEIYADTLGNDNTVELQLDGVTYHTITVNHPFRKAEAYSVPVDGNGEYPRAVTVRCFPTSNFRGFAYRVRWIAEPEPEHIDNWNPIWTEDNHPGNKFVQGIRLLCDTQGDDKQFLVEYDRGQSVGPFTVNTPIRDTFPISFDTPFLSHSLRVRATDSSKKWLYNVDWVWEPAPDKATVWETQETTHDLKGYQHQKDSFIALISTADVTFTITIDGVAQTPYTIASTSGAYRKVYLPFRVNKGTVYKYRLESTAAFYLFVRDTEVRVKEWGSSGPYMVKQPFGDFSREVGARL